METKTTAITTTSFEPRDMTEATAISTKLASSALLPAALRKKPEDVLVTILAGRELGLGPMAAIRGIHVIEGKPTMSADLMVGLVKRSNACEWFRVVESTPTKAVYETKRKGEPQPTRMTWTIEQAKLAGVASKDNWRKYPDAMLRARCASALARAVYPDLLAGCYESDEAEDFRRNSIRQRVDSAPVVEGQVVESTAVEAPAPWDAPAESQFDPLADLRKSITEAQDEAALTALVPAIKALPREQQDALREDYGARRVALTSNGHAAAGGVQ